MNTRTNNRVYAREPKHSMLVEFMLGAFFIGVLLFIALAAHSLSASEVASIHGLPEIVSHEAGAIIMPVGRPHYENGISASSSAQVPAQTAETPGGTVAGQQNYTYPDPEGMYPAHVPPTYHLDEFFSQFGGGVGIYFKNLDTGFVYSYNPDTVFFGASLNKAKHALYIHIAAERGYIDMYAAHTFTAEDWWGGTGIIRFMPAGARLTTRELLRHSVVYSDNVAHRMLARYMSRTGFSYRDFAEELGSDPGLIRNLYTHYTTAADTALWFYAIHTYLESDSRYGHYLRYDLLNTAAYSHPYFTRGTRFGGEGPVNVRLMHSQYPTAHKYGWAVESFNVAGIVYAESPFMLVIISDMDNGAHDLFKEISQLMHEFNARYF